MKLFSGKMLETLLIEQRRYSEGLLPEIIKRLINCSGAEVDGLRIPDGDDVWAPDYDGIVSAKVESRYITAGKSVWEFSCSSDSLAKIESDFEKRTENSLDIDKANTTFYLVVPKIWAYAKAISEWETEHREKWKNVIVYDATILCDWINSELAVAAWLFEIYDKQNPLFECIYRKAGLYLRNRSDAPFVRSKRGFNGTTGKIMCASAERRNHERQKTCGLRHDVSGIDRNSYAESSADG